MDGWITRIGLLLVILLLASCVATRTSFPTKSLGNPYKNPKIVSGRLTLPEGEGPFPVVVLLHTCGGLRPHIGRWRDYLTGLGYAAFAVDSYGPRGVSSCTQLPGGSIAQAEDALGALEHLANLPSIDATRVGVMGFSTGAIAINSHIVNSMKRTSDASSFKAAIAVYGTCRNVYDYSADSIPLMEIAAEKDKNHAPTCIYAKKIYSDIEVHVLPDAHHAFDAHHGGGRYDSGGSFMQFSASATKKARELIKAFLGKHLAI